MDEVCKVCKRTDRSNIRRLGLVIWKPFVSYAAKFMDSISSVYRCEFCWAKSLVCELCDEKVTGWTSINFSSHSQLFNHLLNKHIQASRCENHMYTCYCINFEYECGRNRGGDFRFTPIKKTTEEKIHACVISDMFIYAYPQIILLKICEGEKFINDMCDSREEYFRTGDGIMFTPMYKYEKLVLTDFPTLKARLPEILEIFSGNTYECAICGGDYDSGFPSVDIVAAHLLHAHSTIHMPVWH